MPVSRLANLAAVSASYDGYLLLRIWRKAGPDETLGWGAPNASREMDVYDGKYVLHIRKPLPLPTLASCPLHHQFCLVIPDTQFDSATPVIPLYPSQTHHDSQNGAQDRYRLRESRPPRRRTA